MTRHYSSRPGGVRLFELNPGDYNGDGHVNAGDYVIWSANYGMTSATFFDGDGNGDCVVDKSDYSVWASHFGQTGNANLSADFNRDGCVDTADWVLWRKYEGMAERASRFNGDADGDGDVDQADYNIWMSQFGNCSQGAAAVQGEGSATLSAEGIPHSPDMNGDGNVDESDLAALDEAILGGAAVEPTLAE